MLSFNKASKLSLYSLTRIFLSAQNQRSPPEGAKGKVRKNNDLKTNTNQQLKVENCRRIQHTENTEFVILLLMTGIPHLRLEKKEDK